MTWPNAIEVEPNDTEDNLAGLGTELLYVARGGSLTVLPAYNDTPVVFLNVQPGTLLPVRARRVLATGTDARGIVAIGRRR